MNTDNTTDFGFKQVPTEDKTEYVRAVFDSVAARYDVMNDLMSLGIHRLWKQHTIALANVQAGQFVLDLAGGTGDLAVQFAQRTGQHGMVVLADINAAMLEQGRNRLFDQGCVVQFSQVDAETLPFANNTFDVATMAFGLRNVTDKAAALSEIQRVLKPGGQALILEFSKLQISLLRPLYDLYSFNFLPAMGKCVANDADSYRYLAESIRMHPDQDTLLEMMEQAAFDRCDYHNLSGGIVAIHRGYKL